jgi:hypothetical protein
MSKALSEDAVRKCGVCLLPFVAQNYWRIFVLKVASWHGSALWGVGFSLWVRCDVLQEPLGRHKGLEDLAL